MGRKKSTCLYLDTKVVETAKQLGLNVSKVSENAIKEAIELLKGTKQETGPNSRARLEGRDRDLNPGAGLHRPAKDIVSHFAAFLSVDLQLSQATVKEHTFEIRRFLTWLNGQKVAPKDISRAIVMKYLKRFEDYSTSTYVNVLRA